MQVAFNTLDEIFSLKDLILINIQSHEKSVFEFNQTGLHKLSGENSHGKSVIVKALELLTLGRYIKDRDERRSMIRRPYDCGIVSASFYNGIVLTAMVHLEPSKCYYELEVQGKKIRKYVNDDYEPLLRVVNFHYDDKSDFSLNFYKPKTTLPFTHTSGSLNYRILEHASEVPRVRRAVEEFKNNLALIVEDRKLIERKITAINEFLRSTKVTNTERMKRKLEWVERMKSSYNHAVGLKKSLEGIINASDALSNIILINYEDKKSELENVQSLYRIGNAVSAMIKSSETLVELKSKTDERIPGLEAQLENIRLLNSLATANNAITENTKKMQDIIAISPKDLSEDFNSLRNMTSLMSAVNAISKSSKELDEISKKVAAVDVEKSTTVIEALKLLDLIQNVSKTIFGMQNEIQKCNNVNERLDMELVEINSLIGICDKCGAKIDPERHRKAV